MAELILIVDDEAGVRELLGDALRIAGFETATAQDGMSALTAIRTESSMLLTLMMTATRRSTSRTPQLKTTSRKNLRRGPHCFFQ